MPTSTVSTSTEEDLLSGKLWTVQHTTGSIAAAGEELVGILTGPKDVIYQARTYSGTTSDALVTLYEDTWSGGSPVLSANRNLRITLPGPATYASGITGTPLTPKTSIRLFAGAATGSSQLGNVPEGEWYLLKSGTRYILRIQNLGVAAGILNFRWTYRAVD